MQWTGSAAQRDALARVGELSRAVHDVRPAAAGAGRGDLVDEAYWRLLRAETSCNFFWGEDWVGRCHADLDAAAYHLALAKEADARLALSRANDLSIINVSTPSRRTSWREAHKIT